MPYTTVALDTEEVRRRHARAGLNQVDLANAIGVHPKHLSRVLGGHIGATPPLVLRIAKALDCEIADLLIETEES